MQLVLVSGDVDSALRRSLRKPGPLAFVGRVPQGAVRSVPGDERFLPLHVPAEAAAQVLLPERDGDVGSGRHLLRVRLVHLLEKLQQDEDVGPLLLSWRDATVPVLASWVAQLGYGDLPVRRWAAGAPVAWGVSGSRALLELVVRDMTAARELAALGAFGPPRGQWQRVVVSAPVSLAALDALDRCARLTVALHVDELSRWPALDQRVQQGQVPVQVR